ncbi:apolipoprotein C-I [Denticeps clupeoides]|uniref:Apolipoprotein C-I n=1 Tax=Denticeps clupeoides TaxID=299321 RepID=A0AAY4AIH1_9TELE|nr:apolipoprotein C-I-like [Denticeps clupeoides]
MKLPIAIAVLVLVLAAHSEAQNAEPTLEERFQDFQNSMKTMTDDLTGKAKTAIEQIHSSDFAVKTRNWFTEQFDKMKKKVDETFSQQ